MSCARSSGYALRKRTRHGFSIIRYTFRESASASRVGGSATSGSHRKGFLYALGEEQTVQIVGALRGRVLFGRDQTSQSYGRGLN